MKCVDLIGFSGRLLNFTLRFELTLSPHVIDIVHHLLYLVCDCRMYVGSARLFGVLCFHAIGSMY